MGKNLLLLLVKLTNRACPDWPGKQWSQLSLGELGANQPLIWDGVPAPNGRGWAPLSWGHRDLGTTDICASHPQRPGLCCRALQQNSVGTFLQASHCRAWKLPKHSETFQSQAASVCSTSEMRTGSRSFEFIGLFTANLTLHELSALLCSFDMFFWRYLIVQGDVNHSWGTKNIGDTLWCFPLGLKCLSAILFSSLLLRILNLK